MNIFNSSDGWLLYSLSRRYLSIKDIITTGDHFNHAIFTYDELNGGLVRLIQNGYAEELNSKYKITQKGSNFIKIHTSMFKGSIANTLDLCDAIIKTHMEVEVDYSQPIISFSEYENIINKYK